MSLNQISSSTYSIKKEWMSINCKDIKCENITETNGIGNTYNVVGNLVNLDSTGLKRIIKTIAGSTTLASLSAGFDGQIIEIITFDTGSDITVLHNQNSGATNEKEIKCQSNVNISVRLTSPLGFTLGSAKLVYSTTAGYWVCFVNSPA